MGIVTPVAASDDASIWHLPSKIPPGSITMHGECTSPVTTPLAWISTRPFAKITPSKRPEITTRFPSICPSTLAPSPKTTVCSEIMLPRTLPSMRNVPVSCRVPSRVTPWSINPVHSSLTPFFEEPGHFHAMTFLLVDSPTVASGAHKSTHRTCRVVQRIWWNQRTGQIVAGFAGLLHQSIVNSHQLRVVVVFQNQLAGPHFRLLPKEDLCSQVPLQFIDRRSDIGVDMNLRRRASRART